MIFVTADTDIGLMDMLRMAISCLTGIGALVLIAVLLFVAWLLVVLHQEKHKKPVETEPLVVDWEAILEEVQIFDETGEPIAPPPPPKEYDGPPIWKE